MLFALALLFVCVFLGLLIYRSEFFHATSDEELNSKEDINTTENQEKK